MAKKGKPKISKVKRNNLTKNKMQKQGTNKTRRHKKSQPQKQKVPEQEPELTESDESEDDLMDMIDADDLDYLKEQVTRNKNLLSSVPTENESISRREKIGKPTRKRKQVESDDEALENEYEKENISNEPAKKMRHLLPIKTKQGLVTRETEQDESEEETPIQTEQEITQHSDNDSIASEDDEDQPSKVEDPLDEREAVTTADLMVARKRELVDKKYRIGTLCSGLLESPEKKLRNFYPLFQMMDEKNKDGSENLVSVRKLATLSLYEVFKDVLPDYMIKHQDFGSVKLKKDTLTLYKFEKELLEFYKRFLQRCERAANLLRPKKGDKRRVDPALKKLGLLSLKCLCGILESKPYFNYAVNISQTIVPFMNSREFEVRSIVSQCCANIFKEDKKGEITLTLVRRINHLVKSRSNNVQPEAITCLMSLRIKDVNLDAEKDLEVKQKKDEARKKRVINLSKKEKKRKKKMREVEKEMLETEAEESKLIKQKNLTEVIKTVFMIYFRILKNNPESKLLSATLEGLSKFAHVINLDFYTDLVKVLRHLLDAENITARQRLHCIQTIFNILSGQGEALCVDPDSFYTHLYASLLDVHAGKTSQDLPIVIDTLTSILIKRRRKISQNIVLAYVKRLATLSLQVQHHGSLACLSIIRTVAQHTKAIEILLELEETFGSGRYDRFMKSPEYCGAGGTALFEVALLSHHYHPHVKELAHNVCLTSTKSTDTSQLTKLSPEQFLKQYDGSQMAFKPSIPVPKKTEVKKKVAAVHHFSVAAFEAYCQELADNVEELCEFNDVFVK